MCTAGVDCKFCDTIETCPKVRAAFPTDAEIEAAKPRNIKAREKRGTHVPGPMFRLHRRRKDAAHA